MCDWKSGADEYYMCCVSPEPGSRFCILHEPGEKDVARFTQVLNDQTEEIGEVAKRNQKHDFRGHVFPHGITIRTSSNPGIVGEGGVLECGDGAALNLAEAVVRGRLNLMNARVNSLQLMQATVEGAGWLLGTSTSWVADFRGARFKAGVALSDASFDRILHLADTRFEGDCAFDGCKAGALNLGENRPTILPLVRNRRGVSVSLKSAESFWRFVRRHYEGTDDNGRAGAAFYFQRLARLSPMRLSDSGKGSRVNRFLERWTKRVLAVLFRWLPDAIFLRWPSAYGASLPRLFATWAVLIGGFASAYYLLVSHGRPLFSAASQGLQFPFSFGRSLYFSIITFTTLGYGDIQPAPGLGSALCAVEAILGGIMMALTVLVIGRKFMR